MNKYTEIYYENGNLKYEGMVKNKIENGYGKKYYENGRLQYEGEWHNGLYHGKGKIYNEDGTLKFNGKWINGKIDREIESISIQNSEEIIRTKLDEYMDDLNSLIGLMDVKKELHNLINFVKVQNMREKMNLPTPKVSLHMVFTGNPGTGKTTVARILGNIFRELGVVKKGHFIETDRSGMVAGYTGQTALKTQDIIKEAIGGVLFIDEAYSLSSEGTGGFGQEAIDTLIKLMEDNRDNLIVIVAGYEDEMNNFLKSNPGMKSRFNRFIEFKDYNSDELIEIFYNMCKTHSYKLDLEADAYLKEVIENMIANKNANFGNGRVIRNIFEKVITYQSNRIVNIPSIKEEEMITIKKADFLRLDQNKELTDFN